MSAYPALAIGVVAGGPGTNHEWSKAVRELGRRVIAVREGVISPLSLNIVFQIPGTFLQTDFQGVRTGRFSRKDARLLIQVALPQFPGSNADVEVRGLLSDAVSIAEDFARAKGLIEGTGLAEVRGILDKL